MKPLIAPMALLTLQLPHLITAQCPACDSYTAALKSCQTTSTNVTAVGTTMDTTSVNCMCVAHSNAGQMNTCQACYYSNTDIDILVLLGWHYTCTAGQQFGAQQAVSCWEAQPSNYVPCLSNTVGKGSGTTNGGSGLLALTSSASSPPATMAPTPMAKSDAMLPFKAHGIFSMIMIALGVLVGA